MIMNFLLGNKQLVSVHMLKPGRETFLVGSFGACSFLYDVLI